MDSCYNYFQCKKYDCVMHGKDDESKCWNTRGTLCNSIGQELIIESKKDKCQYCIYYKKAKNIK